MPWHRKHLLTIEELKRAEIEQILATAGAFRRRGFGAAATRAVLRDGAERGASVAILQTSPLGHRVYEALGFREVVRYRVFLAGS